MWPFRTRSVGYLALLLGGAVLVTSADAHASTVFADVEDFEEDGPLGPERFVAGPGEKNRLRCSSKGWRNERPSERSGLQAVTGRKSGMRPLRPGGRARCRHTEH